MKIRQIQAYQILDSRGIPTIKCVLTLHDGMRMSACVPSGASTGAAEAYELRDGDTKRFFGKSVTKAINNIHTIIAPELLEKELSCADVDSTLLKLDGTHNKSNLGANALLAVSMAAVRAQACVEQKELYDFIHQAFLFQHKALPSCMFNIINGGMHANNGLSFQEFLIVPKNKQRIIDILDCASTIYHTLKNLLKEQKLSTNVGDEGGFAPCFSKVGFENEQEALSLIARALQQAGYSNSDVGMSLDVAATSFYDAEKNIYNVSGRAVTREELLTFYQQCVDNFSLLSIEDGITESDWQGWQEMNQQLGDKTAIVGDDLFVTDTKKIQQGISLDAANAVLIKPNQIGTVSETVQAIKCAQKAGYKVVISHRSGETNDSFIADLAVGCGADYIKAGAPVRGERVAKYNRLLEIEQALSSI